MNKFVVAEFLIAVHEVCARIVVIVKLWSIKAQLS